MYDIFFDIIRAGIGGGNVNPRILSADEWDYVRATASRHALKGVVFAGVLAYIEALKNDGYSESDIIPRKFYLKWLATVSLISQWNEKLDEACHALHDKFRKAGFGTCILKGQGLSRYYGELSSIRQSGDIDIWMWPEGEWSLSHLNRMKSIVRFLKSQYKCEDMCYHHIGFHIPNGISVEAHFTPSWMFSPFHNRRLQKWLVSQAPSEMQNEFSTLEYNRVYILLHIFRHLFFEGVGLRQIVDYYFVLHHRKITDEERSQTMQLLGSFGLSKFASALMWILHEKLGMPTDWLLCEPNADEGAFLLSEVLQAGNFGLYDQRISHDPNIGKFALFLMHVRRNLHFLTHYPSEVLWCPLWKLWHQLWLLWYRAFKFDGLV